MTTNPDPTHQAGSSAEHEYEDVPREVLVNAMARRTPAWKPIALTVVMLIAVGSVVGVGVITRGKRHDDVKEASDRLAALAHRVQVGAVRVAPLSRTLTLPASLQPNAKADLFAQATGYVRERKVDIGDRVKTGDVLAVIDVPLLEEDMTRARAALAQAEATRAETEKARTLAKSTLERWKNVQPAGAVSKQEIDERTFAMETAEAAFAAADAAVATRRSEIQRIERQRDFARVVAPIDGTVAARNTDVGDYISSAGPSGEPMFSIADTQTIRAYVDVPQIYAQGIQIGQPATILLREVTGSALTGTVTRTSGSLNERSRTLRIEVTLPNETGRVLAGAYGQIQLEVKQSAAPVVIPGSSLLIRAEGTRVAIVDDESKLRYVNVTPGRDLGNEIEIITGLTGNERVVMNMADELPEGTVVEVIALPPPPSAPAATPAAAAGSTPASKTTGGTSSTQGK